MSYYVRITRYTMNSLQSVRWRSAAELETLRDGIVALEGQPMPPIRAALTAYLDAFQALRAKLAAAPTPPLDLFTVDADNGTHFTVLVFQQAPELDAMYTFLAGDSVFSTFNAARDALATLMGVTVTVQASALLPLDDIFVRPTAVALDSLM